MSISPFLAVEGENSGRESVTQITAKGPSAHYSNAGQVVSVQPEGSQAMGGWRASAVLCIGDDPLRLNLRCSFLKANKWRVLSAGSGYEGP